MSNFRHPRRRAISIGPQSEADAYETLAYREKRRRESQSSSYRESPADGETNGSTVVSRKGTKLDEFENMMGKGSPNSAVAERDASIPRSSPLPPPAYDGSRADEKEVFSQIKKPRVRYDVEVVTKLVVYAGMYFFHPLSNGIRLSNASIGIPWVVINVAPYVFDMVGLGVSR